MADTPPQAEQRPLLSGHGTPVRQVGTTGDVYIDLQSWLIFGPKSHGHWRIGHPVERKRTTKDDLPLATSSGVMLTTNSGAALVGDAPSAETH